MRELEKKHGCPPMSETAILANLLDWLASKGFDRASSKVEVEESLEAGGAEGMVSSFVMPRRRVPHV